MSLACSGKDVCNESVGSVKLLPRAVQSSSCPTAVPLTWENAGPDAPVYPDSFVSARGVGGEGGG